MSGSSPSNVPPSLDSSSATAASSSEANSSQVDDKPSQAKSEELNVRVEQAKRRLGDLKEQLKLKRRRITMTRKKLESNFRDQEIAETIIDEQETRLSSIRQEIPSMTALVEKEVKEIANDEARKEELEKELAKVELEQKLAARKSERLSVADWEIEHLAASPTLQDSNLRKIALQWIEGTATPSSKQHLKSMILSALNDPSDAQITGLVKKLVQPQGVVESATTRGENVGLKLYDSMSSFQRIRTRRFPKAEFSSLKIQNQPQTLRPPKEAVQIKLGSAAACSRGPEECQKKLKSTNPTMLLVDEEEIHE